MALSTQSILSEKKATAPRLTPYYPTLDGLRGIAIALVVFFHSMKMKPLSTLDSWVYRAGRGGWIGVDLFFVLSGFLITGILLHNRGTSNYFRSFYARRTLRIFPLYYFMLMISFWLLPAIGGAEHSFFPDERSEQWWYWTYLSNVLFSIRHYFRHSILGPTWSLAIEEQFYLIWPLVIFLCSPRVLKWLCPVLLLAVVAARTIASFQGVHWVPLYVLSVFRCDGLILGSLISVIVFLHGKSQWLQRAGLLMLIAGGGAGLYLLYIDHLVYRDPIMQRYGYVWVTVFAGGALITAIAAKEHSLVYRVLTMRVLSILGAYSYALYLFNHSVISLTELYWFSPMDLPHWFGSRIIGQLVFSAVCGVISFALAMCSWYLLEQPCLRLKRFFPYSRAGISKHQERSAEELAVNA